MKMAQQQRIVVSALAHKILAGIELSIVPVAMLMEVGDIVIRQTKREIRLARYSWTVATGIWFGFMLFWPALFGLLAAHKQSRGYAITCMILAIVFAVLVPGCISSYAILWNASDIMWYNYEHVDTRQLERSLGVSQVCFHCLEYLKVKNIVGVVLGVIAMVTSIVQAAFCCKNVCSCCNGGVKQVQQGQYAQQSVIYTQQPSSVYMPVQQLILGPASPMETLPSNHIPPPMGMVYQIQGMSQPVYIPSPVVPQMTTSQVVQQNGYPSTGFQQDMNLTTTAQL